MEERMEITLIGTSHIARESILEIKQAFKNLQPQMVAVELDAERAAALQEGQKRRISFRQMLQVGWKGMLFAKIGQYVQQHLGKMVGVDPGAEMKAALELAREHRIPVALIDQPIRVTLRNISSQLTWKEKGRFLQDLLKGIFFRKKYLREQGLDSLDLRKVPSHELIEKLLGEVQKHYPSLYRVLVEDRNRYMVRQLVKLLRLHPGKKILVIVGAGHKKGMEELLAKGVDKVPT